MRAMWIGIAYIRIGFFIAGLIALSVLLIHDKFASRKRSNTKLRFACPPSPPPRPPRDDVNGK